MPGLGLGDASDVRLHLGQVDDGATPQGNGHLGQLAVEVDGRFADERDEFLGRRARNAHALALGKLLHLLRQLTCAERAAIDDGLLVDLGDRLVQTRVLRELLGDEREDGRIVGALEIRDDGLLRRLLETLRRLDDDEALLAHERHRIASRRELVGGERPTFEHVLVEVEIAELCHALVETPVDELSFELVSADDEVYGEKVVIRHGKLPSSKKAGCIPAFSVLGSPYRIRTGDLRLERAAS